MNLKPLQEKIGEMGLWGKTLETLSREEMEALVLFIADHRAEWFRMLDGIITWEDPKKLTNWFARFKNDMKKNLWADQLIRSYAIKLEELLTKRPDMEGQGKERLSSAGGERLG